MRAKAIAIGRDLDRLLRLGTDGSITDPQLLELFLGGNDESASLAFEAIVERHGPMVLRTCRMVLGDRHAAEDAFQATFFVLARKARSLGSRELLCNWLYGVATRISRKARNRDSKQRARDHESAYRGEVELDDTPHHGLDTELCRIVHEEIDRLPGAYRSAVVVCYLQGKSQAQAAEQLELSETTVRGRLARARKLLGRRLTGRGVAPAALLITLESLNACADSVPGASVRATASGALHFLNRTNAAQGTVSALARALAEGELSVMLFHQLKTIAVTVVALGSRATAGVLFVQAPAKGQQRAKAARHDKSATVDSDLAELAVGRVIRAETLAKDGMILSYMPTWDHGEVDNIGFGNAGGGNRTLVEWKDIPEAEATDPEHQFLVALYSRETFSHPHPGPIHAFEITEDWSERVSWQTQPKYDPEPIGTYKFKPGKGWKVFDITPLVRAQAKADRKNHGVLLRFLSEDFSAGASDNHSDYRFVSREGTGEWEKRRPMLLVVKATKP
jgi:RNA polymerase sigma factor (sigma-70 family)